MQGFILHESKSIQPLQLFSDLNTFLQGGNFIHEQFSDEERGSAAGQALPGVNAVCYRCILVLPMVCPAIQNLNISGYGQLTW